MSATILCQGCGGRVPIPDDYTRARLRCPECGVMNDVPAAAQRPAGAEKPRRPAPAASTDIAAEEILLAKEPAPPAADGLPKKKLRRAIQADPPRAPAPLHPLPPSPNRNASDEDDGRPYRVPGLDEERPCPECRKAIARDATFCTFCGYNLETGKRAKQEFEPFDREWRGGWPVNLRRGVFIAAEAFFLAACVASIVAGTDACAVFLPWFFFTVMTAFLLGTYEHIRLTRNKKGRVRLSKTWTFCFVPRAPQIVDVHDYGGVVYGPYDETSILEWLVLIVMFITFIIPGILWLYFVFIRTTFQVALSKEHGYTALVLYRGSNEKMVLDIAETIRNVAHLPKA